MASAMEVSANNDDEQIMRAALEESKQSNPNPDSMSYE